MDKKLEIAKALIQSVIWELHAVLLKHGHNPSNDGMTMKLERATEELNSCESSANCSGTSGTTTSTKDQVTSNDVPAAATPAKLSWCQIMDFPHLPDGEYPLRYHGERFAGSVGIVRGSRWVNLDPTKDKELEYFPIHLV